jgi:hypothetical protein
MTCGPDGSRGFGDTVPPNVRWRQSRALEQRLPRGATHARAFLPPLRLDTIVHAEHCGYALTADLVNANSGTYSRNATATRDDTRHTRRHTQLQMTTHHNILAALARRCCPGRAGRGRSAPRTRGHRCRCATSPEAASARRRSHGRGTLRSEPVCSTTQGRRHPALVAAVQRSCQW